MQTNTHWKALYCRELQLKRQYQIYLSVPLRSRFHEQLNRYLSSWHASKCCKFMWENNCNQTEYPCVKWLQSFCQYNKPSSAFCASQAWTPLRYLLPRNPRGEQTKLAWYVTSAYLAVSNMTLTEDGVTKALWKCVNYPALSGTLGPHVNQKKAAPVPEMQSALGAGLSLSCQLMLQTICSPENTKYRANTLTRFNREPIEYT